MTHPNPVNPGRSFGSGVTRFLQVLTALFAVMFASAVLTAADAPKKYFDIPADNAEKSLKAFASQSDLEVLFVTEATNGVRTQAVRGEMTAHEALDKLLDGTPLVASENGKSGAVKIRREASLAEAEKNGASRPVKTDQAAATTEDGAIKLDTFEVFGRKTLNMDIQRTRDDVQPYVVYNREAIESSGAQSINDFFRTRTTLTTNFQSSNQLLSIFSGGSTSSINLRGLGSEQTLVLVDGRRQADISVGLGTSQPDLNGIPLEAVERIEILPTTASGIYGGSATGGVINIVLRRDFVGATAKVTRTDSFGGGGGENQLTFSAGVHSDGGDTEILVNGAYSKSYPLLIGDRDFVQRLRQHVLNVNPAYYFNRAGGAPLARTTNIMGFQGGIVNLTLKNGTPLNSPVTFVPDGYAGPASDGGSGLLANAGKFNFELADTAQGGGARQSLLGSPTVSSVNATLRRTLSRNLQAFIDGSLAENNSRFVSNYQGSLAVIPASSPANPFAQNVLVTFPGIGTDQTGTSKLQTYKISAGLVMAVPSSEWKAEADASWSGNRFTYTDLSQINTTARNAAIQAGSVDVFRDLNLNGVSFAQFMAPRSPLEPVRTKLQDYAFRIGGPIWSLPAGSVRLSALLEYRDESFGAFSSTVYSDPLNSSQNFIPERAQKITSGYSELLIPVVGDKNPMRWLKMLEFQLAGRWDDYHTDGANSLSYFNGVLSSPPVTFSRNHINSLNPTIGFRGKSTDWLTVRASYGTGFLPPNVNQLVSQPPTPNSLSFLSDPLRGNEALGTVSLTGGGNPALRPEKSESWSAGMIFSLPASAWRVTVDYTNIRKTDNIISPLADQRTLNDMLLYRPERITRGAASNGFSVGPITGWDISAVNLARQDVAAFDLAADYRWRSPRFGNFSWAALATYNPHNKTQQIPSAPIIDNAGVAAVGGIGSVKIRANSTFSWEYKNFTASWTVRYFAGYYLNTTHAILAPQGEASIPSQNYHDLYLAYRGQAYRTRLLSHWDFQVGVNNIFNTKPPIDASALAGYSLLGDPRLGYYYVSARKSF